MPNPSLVRRHKGATVHTLHQLLHVDAIRFVVARARFEWLVRVRRSMRTVSGTEAVSPNTVSHNLKGMRDLAVARSLYLVRPLSVLDDVRPDADILLIGPRTEGEILAFLAHGFERAHIRAVDLISYSPWIDLGDMHDLPHPDRSFDVIVAGWVLAYSDDKAKAAAEILRVARPGATIAIGIEWNSRTDEEIQREFGYHPGAKSRLESIDAIIDLFGSSVNEVLSRQEPAPGSVGTHPLVVVFRVDGQAE